MTAYTFTIRMRELNQVVAQAVICDEARYASVWWKGQTRTIRQFLAPEDWKAVEHELDHKMPSAALEDDSAIARALIHASLRGRYLIHYLVQEPVDDDLIGSGVATVLDQRLRQVQL